MSDPRIVAAVDLLTKVHDHMTDVKLPITIREDLALINLDAALELLRGGMEMGDEL